jgi:hypothetical protein
MVYTPNTQDYERVGGTEFQADQAALLWIALSRNWTRVNSTLKIQTPEAMTLIEKIKAELKKRAEAKAKRMWLRKPKRLARR